MKGFEIREQAKLPLSKCVELVLSGIQFRLFRAVITVAIVALAVAFLMTILGDSLIGREVGESLETLTKPRRTYLFWVRRLSRPLSVSDLFQTMATAEKGDLRWQEFKVWGQCTDSDLDALKSLAMREADYLKFFAELKEGQARRLAGRARGREIFKLLETPAAVDSFATELPGIGKQIPGTMDEFRRFLGEYLAGEAVRQRIIDGHTTLRLKARDTMEGKSVQHYLVDLDKAKADRINSFGFRIQEEEIPILRERARTRRELRQVERSLKNPTLKQRFANRYGFKNLNKVTSDVLYTKVRKKAGAKWFLEAQKEIGQPMDLTVERLRDLADMKISQKRLARIESAVGAQGQHTGFLGFSNRVLWLIGVSLLVCVVGIANAMLMSVTERFKEIATMKCLGAADGFIMVNFVMESGFQGFAGGIVGGVLGMILGVMRSSLAYGLMAFQNLPFLDILVVFLISVAAGVILSIVAAIYPALVAARLAPLEAMRVE